MGQVLVDSNSLTAIAEAIRSKNKKVIKYKPNEMAGAIKALALDNSVVIQSNDAWKYAIDSTLEHQNINVAANTDLMGNNTTGYKSKITFDPTIKSNFGYVAGTIKKTIDSTNHIINFSANPATETNRLTQDGWAPVYIISTSKSSKNYYTTTTPDDVNSFKSISSSDNIENILICGYYTKDNSTGKLSPVDSDKNYVGNQLVSTYTKKIKNTYATSISDNAFRECNKLTSIDVSNATSIGDYAFDSCSALKFIIIDSNTVSTAHVNPQSGVKVLIPLSMVNAYDADSYWSKYKSQLDAIENYTITRENGQITVTWKQSGSTMGGQSDHTTNKGTVTGPPTTGDIPSSDFS